MEQHSISDVVALTGLHDDCVEDFVASAFAARGLDWQEAGLEDLRTILCEMIEGLIQETFDA